MFNFIDPQHLTHCFQKAKDEVDNLKLNADDLKIDCLSAFYEAVGHSIFNIDHLLEKSEAAKNQKFDISIVESAQICMVAQKLRKAKILLKEIDLHWREGEPMPDEILSDDGRMFLFQREGYGTYREYVESFDWTDFREFRTKGSESPVTGIDLFDLYEHIIDPAKQSETKVNLNLALE